MVPGIWPYRTRCREPRPRHLSIPMAGRALEQLGRRLAAEGEVGLQALEQCIAEKFMRPEHGQMWTFVGDVSEVLPAIEASPPWDESARRLATW